MEGEIIMTKKTEHKIEDIKEDVKEIVKEAVEELVEEETDSECQHKIVELEARIVDLEKHCK